MRAGKIARDYDLVIMHTSTPSFPTDARFAQMLREDNPQIRIGMVGAKTMVDPEGSLKAATAVDFVCREEFDYTCKDVAEGLPLKEVKGLSYRDPDGRIVHNLPRADDRKHGRPAVRRSGVQARSEDRELLHRLPETSLRQLLHRTRLPLEVHFLPVAADRRRTSLPGAVGRQRHRGGAVDQGEHARGQGGHVR